MLRKTHSLILVSFFALAACSSDDGGGPGEGGRPDADRSPEAGPAEAGPFDGARPDAGTDSGRPVDAGDVCGDGIRGITEACDDGNTEGGDGCSADCLTVEPGFRCPTPGEPCRPVECGDGRVEGDETCDDGNSASGDGCNAECQIQPGWTCPVPGVACRAAECGDEIVAGFEECDDGNMDAGDGCSKTCKLEQGFVCPPDGGSCSETDCGDEVAEGTEECDDGNPHIGDGCTPFCELEPDCSGGSCEAICGDGQVFPSEECDDGNTRSGDGCSSDCMLEAGFDCTVETEQPPEQLDLPIVYRDFQASHPDMEQSDFCDMVETGMVEDMWGDDGKPVPVDASTKSCLTTQENFNEWYTDTSGVNTTIADTLTVYRQSGCTDDDPATPCTYQFDSDMHKDAAEAPEDSLEAGFFPLDGRGFGNYADTGHNFHFTSEVRFWFQYERGQTLEFSGDDDVWVFINGELAVDIGGVHPPADGSITLDQSNEDQFGLTPGGLYEAAVFQAERHTTMSNYKLTLGGFFFGKTQCSSVCGDGMVTRFELCDDGNTQDEDYGGCGADCLSRGPRCGDGEVQSEHEECDEGTANNTGGYGGCTAQCERGPFCGDGIRQPQREECDAGEDNGTTESSCTEDCQLVVL